MILYVCLYNTFISVVRCSWGVNVMHVFHILRSYWCVYTYMLSIIIYVIDLQTWFMPNDSIGCRFYIVYIMMISELALELLYFKGMELTIFTVHHGSHHAHSPYRPQPGVPRNALHSISLLLAVDCGDPGTPTNGQRSLSSTTYNSVVTYTCDVGYTLQGSNSIKCLYTGQWKGSVPLCIGKSAKNLLHVQKVSHQVIPGQLCRKSVIIRNKSKT